MRIIVILAAIIFLSGCKSNENKHDASGTFEVDEVIVSSEIGGQILSFKADEGDTLSKENEGIPHTSKLNSKPLWR